MSEPMRDPMRRRLTSGRRIGHGLAASSAAVPAMGHPSQATSVSTAWTRQPWRSCQRPGVGRWGSVRRVPGSRRPCRPRTGRSAGLPHLRPATRSGRGRDGLRATLLQHRAPATTRGVADPAGDADLTCEGHVVSAARHGLRPMRMSI